MNADRCQCGLCINQPTKCPLCDKSLLYGGEGQYICPTPVYNTNGGTTHFFINDIDTSAVVSPYIVNIWHASNTMWISYWNGKTILKTKSIHITNEQAMLDKIKLLLTFS